MLKIEQFREIFMGIFELYLAERTDRKRWEQTLKDIHQWVKERAARK